jgi:GT2 family glycosyltransferase
MNAEAHCSAASIVVSKSPVVWLVVSSFRHDREIATMLEQVQNLPVRLFDSILIVDSLGTGEVPAAVARHGWQNVIYRSYDRNLGSAGNLAERLRLAAEAGADFAYALNHDAHVQPHVFRCLLNQAIHLDRVGAVYPIAYLSSAAAYNLTGRCELPISAKLVSHRPACPLMDVYWSSSNGALYALEPVRAGLLPRAELWMGWEDLEYGWRLADHGYRQIIACDAVFDDNYEYTCKATPLGTVRIVNKAPWMTYYSVRNLILIVRRARPLMKCGVIVGLRIVLELLLILFYRPAKRLRLRCLLRGIIDGLKKRTGKWILPPDSATTPPRDCARVSKHPTTASPTKMAKFDAC